VEIRAIHTEVKARYRSPLVHAELAARSQDCCVNWPTAPGSRASSLSSDSHGGSSTTPDEPWPPWRYIGRPRNSPASLALPAKPRISIAPDWEVFSVRPPVSVATAARAYLQPAGDCGIMFEVGRMPSSRQRRPALR